jgi:hypothetical protein
MTKPAQRLPSGRCCAGKYNGYFNKAGSGRFHARAGKSFVPRKSVIRPAAVHLGSGPHLPRTDTAPVSCSGPAARPMRMEHALSDGFGFGGVNASVVFRRWS